MTRVYREVWIKAPIEEAFGSSVGPCWATRRRTWTWISTTTSTALRLCPRHNAYMRTADAIWRP